MFVIIKHDLLIGRDMRETRRQIFLIKNLDWSKELFLFFHILDLKHDLNIKISMRTLLCHSQTPFDHGD